jgi:hypothetical protein
LNDKVWRLDRILPGSELVISDRDVHLNGTLLSGLSEALSASITLTLTNAEGLELATLRQPVELLAHNEWGGVGSMADLIPAFVMPNDPAVDRVLKAASDALRRAGKPDVIDGYLSKERTRVWLLVSALWSAVAGMRLSYALPPASFERVGQKVRTPSQILEGKMATCLDTSLLFAAAMEQAPLKLLTEEWKWPFTKPGISRWPAASTTRSPGMGAACPPGTTAAMPAPSTTTSARSSSVAPASITSTRALRKIVLMVCIRTWRWP